MQWFVYKPKAINNQGKTAKHLYENEAFRRFRILSSYRNHYNL